MENTYEIFTDSSFDDKLKLSTYSVVITKNKKIMKAFGKECKMDLTNSTECEVFAISQAMNIIESNLLQDEKIQKIYLSTDCSAAKEFFKENSKMNIFKRNSKIYNKIKESYRRAHKKMKEKSIYFELRYISRKKNKIAHQYSYKTFKRHKDENPISNIMKNRSELIQFCNKIGIKQGKVLIYLFLISNDDKIISKTQEEIAKSLNLTTSNINRIFRNLKKIEILEKKQNGKYLLKI